MAEPDNGGREKLLDRLSEQSSNAAAIRDHAGAILDEILLRRGKAESDGLSFTAPTAEQLGQKLRRGRSPYIYFQTWNTATPGGTVSYELGITNPDPDMWTSLFVHLFVGAANIVLDVDEAVQAVDPRFPRLTLPRFAGLSVDTLDSEQLSFSIPIPSGVEPGNYLGNSFLFRSVWHDPGTYVDRSVFVFEVT